MNETNNEEIELNGVHYVRKDIVEQIVKANKEKPTNTDGMPYVICRGHECGVHAGFLKEHDGNHATLVKSRRLWYWKAKEGITLSAVAKNGIAGDVTLPNELDEIWLGDVYEVIPCTQEAMDSIVKAGVREQS